MKFENKSPLQSHQYKTILRKHIAMTSLNEQQMYKQYSTITILNELQESVLDSF